jgi:DNA helicase-2/ATP-dependent DNA helicase PcrA
VQAIDFRQALNDEQFAAATADDGPLLVLAAAGTGKTRTLVYRVAYLVGRGIAPDRILLLTFTNRAATEMLDRARDLVGGGAGGVWGGTFHHMANRILRKHASLLGYRSDYTILDRDDSKKLISNNLKEMHVRADALPKPAVLLSAFSSAVNREIPIERAVRDSFGDQDVSQSDILRIFRTYRRRKRELEAMDFDDLLVNCLGLFKEHAHVRERYQEHFEHVLVDEYQDTNTIQSQLVDIIGAQKRNVLVVGDDFQSIYAWRGADFTNIMSFPERYPDTRVFKLETNYRSVPEILEVANACIAGNPDQYQKTLRPTREAYRKPSVSVMRDGDEQARYVAELIRALRRDGYRLRDIAVLYRAHYQALELERTLPHEHIRYVITSGARFFEQAHIKDVCSLLRVLSSPGDEIAFHRLLMLLPGVGEKTALKAWKALGGGFDPRDAAKRRKLREGLRAAGRERWRTIETVIDDYLREGLRNDAGEAIGRFVAAFYERYLRKTYEDFQKRMDDIGALIVDAGRFQSVGTFLSDIALLSNVDAEKMDVGGDEDAAIRLSTIHQAKGLEWPVVIILWATEGMLPLSRALQEGEGGEAEERRLFYVALTRARDELVICVPEVRRTRDGGAYPCQPSRFVADIPPGYVRHERVGFI